MFQCESLWIYLIGALWASWMCKSISLLKFEKFSVSIFFFQISPARTLIKHACIVSHFIHPWLFVTLWAIAHQAPLFMGFSRQEYWRGLPWPPAGDLPNPGIEPESPAASPLQVDSLLLSHRGSPYMHVHHAKCQTEWITSWDQDCQEKYQEPQICRWYH